MLSLQSFDHFGNFFLCNKSIDNGKLGSIFFHDNNKLKRVSQSTTMRDRREVSEDFQNSQHQETTTIPTKTKIKITI